LTAVYLVMGGYFAVAVSDFIRGIVEFAGVLVNGLSPGPTGRRPAAL